MKKRKFLSLALTVALAATMGTTSFAFADTAANTTTTATKTATDVVSTEKATDIVTDLGMFSPAKGSTKVEIDKLTGKAKVTFTTTPLARKYTKLALVEQSKTAKTKEKHAVSAVVTPVSVDGVEKYVSTFTVEISAADLGKALPISMYQVFTKASGEKIDGWYSFEAQHYLTVKFTPELVTNLTSAIYYQERTAGTDVLCEAAGRGWNALTDAEQKEVTGFGYYLEEDEEKGGYEYFAEDTGDASKDDPLNQDKIGSYEILVGSFGTSYNDNRAASIGAIEKAVAKAIPNFSVRRGFTSQIIINHIQARDNEVIDNMEQAVERAIKNKVQVLVVQPTTLMSGAEFDELKEKLKSYEWKKLLSSRNFIILGCVLVIGAGVIVTSVLSGGNGGELATGNDSGSKILGNTVLVGNESSGTTAQTGKDVEENDSYFAITVINRQRVRDEALEVLREVADNPDVMPDVKEDALASIASITSDMAAESSIETLVKSKGFDDCVAVISDKVCSVVVKSDELLPDDAAKILEIVLQNTTLSAENVRVIPKK